MITIRFYRNTAECRLAAFQGEVASGADYLVIWTGTHVPRVGELVFLEAGAWYEVRTVAWVSSEKVHILVELDESKSKPVPRKWSALKMPWREPEGIYATNGPDRTKTFFLEDIRYRVSPLGKGGTTTGRGLYRVECLTCEEEVAGSTTGPGSRIHAHHNDFHRE